MKSSEAIRYLLVGGFNTAATYLIYLVLLNVLAYPAAYTVSYVAGIVIAYTLNTLFVFRSSHQWTKLGLFSLIYVGQYLLGLALLSFYVQVVGLSARVAPLLVLMITIPVAFVLNRWILKGPTKGSSGA
ncbi:MAG TPA: GtrA family protein [Thermoanaerobaculia bacterium]